MKNKSFLKRTIHSSFWSVEATDIKNAIWNKIHWAASEAAKVQRSFSTSPRQKFQNHLPFHNGIFIIFVFNKISKGMLVTVEEIHYRKRAQGRCSPGNIFKDYIFEISGFHWSKCTAEWAICLTLILKSIQARCEKCSGQEFCKVVKALITGQIA